jgi:hypothetical protein
MEFLQPTASGDWIFIRPSDKFKLTMMFTIDGTLVLNDKLNYLLSPLKENVDGFHKT